MNSADREAVKGAFQAAPTTNPIRLLLATDATSEGLNLQNHCRYLVHMELPWNPNRLEQRNGRIDRHGQRADEVFCYHFVYRDHADSRFLQAVIDKVQTMRADLGSVGEVIAAQVEEAMLGRRKGLVLPEERRRLVQEQVQADRLTEHRARDLSRQLNITRGQWQLYPENLQRVLHEALRLSGHPEVRQWLGCPFSDFRQDEHFTRAAVQTFERGWLLWLETDTVANVDPIYVFYSDNGSFTRYGDRPLADAPQYAPTVAGFYKVGDRFVKIYWEDLTAIDRARLGRATNEARDSEGAFQEFERGRMFWAGQADAIYLIYAGEFDLDGDGQTTWQQLWTSYEDTFEAPAP